LASDLAVGLVRTTDLGTGSGVDIEHEYVGLGDTPKLALCMLNGATTLQASVDWARFTFGAADGSNAFSTFITSEHGVTTTNANAKGIDNAAAGGGFYIGNANAVRDGWGELSASTPEPFTADKVNWYVSNGMSNANYPLTTAMFGGDDITVDVQTFNPNATEDAATTVTFGFQPDIVILNSMLDPFTDATSGSSDLTYGMGFATNDGTIRQASVAISENDAETSSKPGAYVSNNRAGSALETGLTLAYTLEASDFTSTTVDFITRDSAASAAHDWGVIGIKLAGDLKATCGTVTTHTTAATKAYTATELPGMAGTPQFIMQIMSLVETANTAKTDREAGGFGVRWATGAEEFSHYINIEDAASTTNTECGSYNTGAIKDHDGTAGIAVNIDSMDSDGWTDNFTTVDSDVAGGLLWPTLIISDDPPASGASGPILYRYYRQMDN